MGQCLTAIKTITLSQFVSDIHKSNYHDDSDLYLLQHFSQGRNEKNKTIKDTLQPSSIISPNFEIPFETILINANDDVKQLNQYDLNLLFYIAGSALNAMFKKKVCDDCKLFFDTFNIDEKKNVSFLYK